MPFDLRALLEPTTTAVVTSECQNGVLGPDSYLPELAAIAAERVPTMGRVGTLGEIADAVAFLVSPRASYITGTNLRLDGGMWPGVWNAWSS